MSVILYLIVGVIALGYLWVKKRYNYWTDRGFLSPPPIFPFGSLKGVGTELQTAVANDKFYRNFKGKAPAIGIYFFLEPTLLILDPELYKTILVREFSSFHDRAFYYNKEDDPTSASMLALEGQEWRERRVKLSPIFTSGKMKTMFEIVDSIGERLIHVIEKNLVGTDSLDMKDLAAKYTSDVIGNVAFGLECKCLEDPNSEFLKHGRRLFDITPFELMKFIFSSSFPNLARKLHLRQNPKEPTDFFLNTFLQTLDYREKNNIKRNDFVSLLLGLKEYFTPVELAAESFLVYAGGFETSSTLITFALYEIAIHTEIQERLRDEIKSGLDENEGKLTYDTLFGFKYLDMVINETLRKFPPIPNVVRVCTKEFTIPETSLVVPEGTKIELVTYSLQHDPEYFPDPEKFDPERFSPENVKNMVPFTFLPFGEGPRNCIGMRFGLMQSKMAIAKLLMKYEISPTSKTPIPMKFVPSAPFLAPVGGMWLQLKEIKQE